MGAPALRFSRPSTRELYGLMVTVPLDSVCCAAAELENQTVPALFRTMIPI